MQAICGFVRLDGGPVHTETLARLRSALVFNPARHAACYTGCVAGAVALGGAAWGASDSTTQSDSPLYRDAESGCIALVDARLDERNELAARLGLPHHTPRPSQAELIARAWLRWGEECPEKLHGDFAFAVWDPHRQQLFCARDIMGVRPLNVHHQPGKLFAFASRAQALLALPGVPGDLDEGRIADALVQQLEGVDKRCTFYQAVQRLPPAHCISIQSHRSRERQYWQLQPRLVSLPTTDDQWAEALTQVLERAVRRHLDSDANIGCMLSGGMDSSSLAVIAADQLAAAGKPPLATFSSIDSDPADAETRAIRAMLTVPGFNSTLIDPGAIDAMRVELVEAAWQADEPFDSSMVLLRAQYLAASRNGLDAVIDGIDGDMLFSATNTLIRQLRQLHWHAVWRNIRGFKRLYPDWHALHYVLSQCRSAFLPDRLRRHWRRDRLGQQARDAIQTSLICPEFALDVDLRDRLRRLNGWRAGNVPHDATVEAAQSLSHSFTTCGIERYHRVAAWYGVDPRHPLLDRGVFELVVNLPDGQRLANGWSKAVLRRAMSARMPESVRLRTDKQHLGWNLIKRILLGDHDLVRQRLSEFRYVLAPYIDATKLASAVQRWQHTHQREAGVALLEAISLGTWLNRRQPQRTSPGWVP